MRHSRATPRRRLELELDKLWSIAIQKRALGRCEICGVAPATSSHHSIKRGNRACRWAMLNGTATCFYCHEYAERNSAAFFDWLKANKPDRHTYYMLHRYDRSTGPIPLSRLKALREAFREI